jgi:hypothetical protein
MRNVPELIPFECSEDIIAQREEDKKTQNQNNISGAVFCTINKDGKDIEVVKIPVFIGYIEIPITSLGKGRMLEEKAAAFGFKAYNHMATVGEGDE